MKIILTIVALSFSVSTFAKKINCVTPKSAKICSVKIETGRKQRGVIACNKKGKSVFKGRLSHFIVMGSPATKLEVQARVVTGRNAEEVGHVFIKQTKKNSNAYVSLWNEKEHDYKTLKMNCKAKN